MSPGYCLGVALLTFNSSCVLGCRNDGDDALRRAVVRTDLESERAR